MLLGDYRYWLLILNPLSRDRVFRLQLTIGSKTLFIYIGVRCPNFLNRFFVKASPKRSYSVIENERFGLVFVKTGSINSGTRVIQSIGTYLPYMSLFFCLVLALGILLATSKIRRVNNNHLKTRNDNSDWKPKEKIYSILKIMDANAFEPFFSLNGEDR